LADAVVAGGGQVVPLAEAEALVWAMPTGPDDLARAVANAPGVHWVQLPWAGVEPFLGVLDEAHLWTCGKGVYAEPVAELALTLALAGMRGLGTYARASRWEPPQGQNLLGAEVIVVGGGGIAASLCRLLGPFDSRVTVIRRTQPPTLDDLDGLLPAADLVVLALALTPITEGLFDRRRLGLMKPTAWLVNVARGRHVVTDDLVDALATGAIGGAGLDVTDPEPLPEGHPLWSLPNCLITPHVGNTPEMAVPLLAARVTENVRRFAAGEPLIGPVDVKAGY
jgi:phosphoglycerate dehydrogenase-like enzyme